MCFCFLPGDTPTYLRSVRYDPPLSTSDLAERGAANWRGLGLRTRFERSQGQVTSRQHGRPCKIDCGGHSLGGGRGGANQSGRCLSHLFGGTKVGIFVFLKHSWSQRVRGAKWGTNVSVVSAAPYDCPLRFQKWFVVERRQKSNPGNGDLWLDKPAFS